MEYAAWVAFGLGAGIVLAWGIASVLGLAGRATRRGITRARGADRPEWAPGIWMCAHCRSSNAPTADRCARCRAPRDELAREPVAARPDWIPAVITVGPGDRLSLQHDPTAHSDATQAHWRMAVGGRLVGSAQARSGALALLEAVTGTDVIRLDLRGTGPGTYHLLAVIERFRAPAFPLDVPCPERGR